MSRSLIRTLALGTSVAVLGLGLSACSLLPFGNRTSSLDLVVGQCIQVPDGESVSTVAVIDCTEEHTGEVYHIEKLTGSTRPSDDEMQELMEEACFATFEGYVGKSFDESTLEITALYPTTVSWAKGDRSIVCLAIPADDGKLTQSVRESGL